MAVFTYYCNRVIWQSNFRARYLLAILYNILGSVVNTDSKLCPLSPLCISTLQQSLKTKVEIYWVCDASPAFTLPTKDVAFKLSDHGSLENTALIIEQPHSQSPSNKFRHFNITRYLWPINNRCFFTKTSNYLISDKNVATLNWSVICNVI